MWLLHVGDVAVLERCRAWLQVMEKTWLRTPTTTTQKMTILEGRNTCAWQDCGPRVAKCAPLGREANGSGLTPNHQRVVVQATTWQHLCKLAILENIAGLLGVLALSQTTSVRVRG